LTLLSDPLVWCDASSASPGCALSDVSLVALSPRFPFSLFRLFLFDFDSVAPASLLPGPPTGYLDDRLISPRTISLLHPLD